MDPTNRPLTITVNEQPLCLVFDLNTFAAFEDVTGKMFLGWLETIQNAVREAGIAREKLLSARLTDDSADVNTENGNATSIESELTREDASVLGGILLHSVSMKDFRALVWAANHTYNRQEEPVWPLTIGKIGALITLSNFGALLPVVLRGSLDVMPAPKKDEGEAESKTVPFVSPKPPRAVGNGGKGFGPSDEAVLDLLERS